MSSECVTCLKNCSRYVLDFALLDYQHNPFFKNFKTPPIMRQKCKEFDKSPPLTTPSAGQYLCRHGQGRLAMQLSADNWPGVNLVARRRRVRGLVANGDCRHEESF